MSRRTSTATTQPGALARRIPALAWLPRYRAADLRFDLVAGATAAAVVIPQAMAYAAIAGLPVQVGLYVALAPMVVYALLGTSRPLSVSSTSTISILVAGALVAVLPSAAPEAYIIPAATLALLVGVFLVLAAFFKLGFVSNFISLPVLTGFKAGIGIVIGVGQLGEVLGFSVEKAPTLRTLAEVAANLGNTHLATLAVSLGTLAILLLLPRISPRIPASLVAVAAAIAASALLHMQARGVTVVGAVPPGLPHFSLPD